MDKPAGFSQPGRGHSHGNKGINAHKGNKQNTADECFQARVHVTDIALHEPEGKGDRMPRWRGLNLLAMCGR